MSNNPSNVPPIGTYVRHNQTGDLAQIIEKDGKLVIKPDLPGSPVFYAISSLHNYRVELRAKRLPIGSWARVAYEADRALCDIHPELKRQKEWIALSPLDRAQWIEGRAKLGHPLRVDLHNMILKLLENNSD